MGSRKADPRLRSMRHHLSNTTEPMVVEWASEKQRAVFEWGPTPVCASGGFGSAKTFALCLKALYLSELYPNNRGVICRRVYNELVKTTMSTFFKLLPPEAYEHGRRSEAEKCLVLNNGSEVLWAYLDDPDSDKLLRGLEINWFLLDQAEEIEEESFNVLMTRLGRWDKAVVPQGLIDENGGIDKWPWKNPAGKAIPPVYAMIACNPDTELHWIYQRFHPDSDTWREKYQALGYQMFTMSSEENKFLPKQNLDEMLRQDESFVRRFVRGEWGIPEGQIHTIDPSSFVEHTVELIQYLTEHCSLYRTLDHGDSSPTACAWWAVDHEGNIFCYREYYMPARLISFHRQEIFNLSGFERYSGDYADPSIFSKTMQRKSGMWSVADEYCDTSNMPKETAIWWQAADNNEMGTRNRINEYLRVDEKHIHPITKEQGAPHLFFVKASPDYPNGCRRVIIETRSQKRLKIGSDQGRTIFGDDRDDQIPDHGYDLVRYLIASRPSLAPTVMMGRTFGNMTFAGQRRKLARYRKTKAYVGMKRQMQRDQGRLANG